MEEITASAQTPTVRNWATQLDPNALEMAKRTARSPAVSGPVALMPDAHWGMGATIGSVIPTRSAIIPAAVGVDIGCGMIAARTSSSAADLPDDLGPLLTSIGEVIPAGFNWHDDATKSGAAWMAANPMPTPEVVKDAVRGRAAQQMGTLGGGNHFVEVCVDESDTIWLVLHSGSRGIGNGIAQHFISDAKQLCADQERALEDPDLAYYLTSDPAMWEYVQSMLWAQAYAAENRRIMMTHLLDAYRAHTHSGIDSAQVINCHHNYCVQEVHDGHKVWITRKGAIAAGRDDWGVIPGSMGAASFIVRGLGNPASYNSASHGAGRRLGRKQTKREHTVDEFRAAMPAGVTWQSEQADDLLDEAPFAYKDIDQVMADQSDLVEVQAQLRCVLNYKGIS